MSLSRRAKVWHGSIGGGVVLALVVAGVAVLFAFRDVATTLDEEEVGLTVITGGGGPGDYGLYVYATTGYETTDALAGARHDYPAETYLTIQPGGCGTLVRWQPLEQRYEEWDYCPDGRMAGLGHLPPMVPVRQHRRLAVPGAGAGAWGAGRFVDDRVHPAETDKLPQPPSSTRSKWSGTSRDRRRRGSGDPARAHQSASSAPGARSRPGQQDTWYLVGTQLPVRRVLVHDSITDSRIGEVGYTEQFEILLNSLHPGA